MAKIMYVLTAQEIHECIQYALIAMTRYGSAWGTMRRKRRWKEEFTDAEREKAGELFRKAYSWTCGRGVPDKVTMSAGTLALWKKLEAFCGSL